MGARHDESVPVEHRAMVEKSDEGLFVQDHMSRDGTLYDPIEDAL
jgi:hypothetical protein